MSSSQLQSSTHQTLRNDHVSTGFSSLAPTTSAPTSSTTITPGATAAAKGVAETGAQGAAHGSQQHQHVVVAPLSHHDGDNHDDEAGMIWVASRVTQPANLDDATFVRWYEDVHVGEVLATGGVPGAARWQRVYPPLVTAAATTTGGSGGVVSSGGGGGGIVSVAAAISNGDRDGSAREGERWQGDDDDGRALNGLLPYPYLTMYAFPSLAFRFTRAFRALDGQSMPKGDLFQRIFSQAEFATRFCAVMQDSAGLKVAARPRPYLAVLSFRSADLADALGDRVRGVLKSRGYHAVENVQVYATRASTVLSEFNRRSGFEGWMVQIGLNREMPWEGLLDAVQSVIAPAKLEEWGIFKRGRMYEEWCDE